MWGEEERKITDRRAIKAGACCSRLLVLCSIVESAYIMLRNSALCLLRRQQQQQQRLVGNGGLSEFVCNMRDYSASSQWEAIELTANALNKFTTLTDPLPSKLTKELLPSIGGIHICDVKFRPSQVYAGTQRVCDVEYTRMKDDNPPPVRKGTLESVVWNFIVFRESKSKIVPRDLRLCSVETKDEFLKYLYIALGHNHLEWNAQKSNRCTMPYSPAREPLFRSWAEANYGNWDVTEDLTTRYAKLRCLVPFPPGFEDEFPDPVVTIRKHPTSEKISTAQAKHADAGVDAAIARAFEKAYTKQRRDSAAAAAAAAPLTWGLGAVAFFGACKTHDFSWDVAIEEASMWLSAATSDTDEVLPTVLVRTFDPSHFPEAMFALSRKMFHGDMKTLVAVRKRILHSLLNNCKEDIRNVEKDVVFTQLREASASRVNAEVMEQKKQAGLFEKPYMAKIGTKEHFGEALANGFWIDMDPLETDDPPAIEELKLTVKQIAKGITNVKSFVLDTRSVDASKIPSLDKWKHAVDSEFVTTDTHLAVRNVFNEQRDWLLPSVLLDRVDSSSLGILDYMKVSGKSMDALVDLVVSVPDVPRDPAMWLALCKHQLAHDYAMWESRALTHELTKDLLQYSGFNTPSFCTTAYYTIVSFLKNGVTKPSEVTPEILHSLLVASNVLPPEDGAAVGARMSDFDESSQPEIIRVEHWTSWLLSEVFTYLLAAMAYRCKHDAPHGSAWREADLIEGWLTRRNWQVTETTSLTFKDDDFKKHVVAYIGWCVQKKMIRESICDRNCYLLTSLERSVEGLEYSLQDGTATVDADQLLTAMKLLHLRYAMPRPRQ